MVKEDSSGLSMLPQKLNKLSCISINSDNFLRQLQEILEQQGEALVVIQKGLGSISVPPRSYRLVKTNTDFDNLLQQLPPQPDLFVIMGNPLPLRGIADDLLLQHALQTLQSPNEFLLISLEPDEGEPLQFEGDLSDELETVFDEFRGQRVAFGNFLHQFVNPQATKHTKQQRPIPLAEVRIGLQRVGQNKIEVVPITEPANPGQRTKLGGSPEWIQRDDTPKCPACRRNMTFVAQIDSFDQGSPQAETMPGYMFADVGMIYVFYCFDCLRTKSVVQFH